MKQYSIDGIYGRVEITQLDQQQCLTTYNVEELDQNHMTRKDSEEFLSGTPYGISMDDYFKIALIQKLDKIANELHASNKKEPTINIDIDKIFQEVIKKLDDMLKQQNTITKI